MLEITLEVISRFIGWIGYGLVELFNKFIEFCGGILTMVFGVLPKSPFAGVTDLIQDVPFLGYLNFLIPLAEIISILTFWLGAIGLWYVWQIILRWIKAIE